MSEFKKDINEHLSVINHFDTSGIQYLNALVNTFDSCTNILDKHAPLLEKVITLRRATPWNNADIKAAKTAKRRAEKRWRKTKTQFDFDNFKEKRNEYNTLLNNLRTKQLAEKIKKCNGNSKALFKIVNSALNRKPESPLPSDNNDQTLATKFSKFFDDKIKLIRSKFQDEKPQSATTHNTFNGTPLAKFNPVEPESIRKLINKMPTKHSHLDSIPTWLLKECLDEFLPIITEIVNT
jgi:hypothetical protein